MRIRTPIASRDEEPLRGELLNIDSLRQFAISLARDRRVENGRGPNLLLPRLAANEKILRDYNARTLAVETKRPITPAAEWLLDNFHLIEEQIRTATRHLPRGFNRQLPRLLNGPWKDFPRVYEVAAELISHTDGRVDASHLNSFVAGYQEIVALKLGELWAIPIMLRLALIENLRRITTTLSLMRRDRDRAEHWADQVLRMAETQPSSLIIVVGEMARLQPSLSRVFVTEFLRRLQEKSLPVKLAVGWIEERIAEDGHTVEQLVQDESHYQAATQVSVGNCIGSLRFLDTMDWRAFVETQSVVEQTLRQDPAGIYVKMDFATRDLYRHGVERIARLSPNSEPEVAVLAVGLAQKYSGNEDNRLSHVGFFLAGKGVAILERAAEMRIPVRSFLPRLGRQFPLAFYLGGIIGASLVAAIPLLHWAAAGTASGPTFGLVAMLILLCTSQLGVSLVNWLTTLWVKPAMLPRLDFSAGIPDPHATLVVVPTLLTSGAGIENLLDALEVRYLSNPDRNVYFALLTDFSDAAQEHEAGDEELVRQAVAGIEALNLKYRNERPGIFFLLHRPRLWNAQEKIWMGYERKRGKLGDLNRFLRGGGVGRFSRIAGDIAALPRIQYVITLDTDTQLPRDAARQLAATMAHPLNRPIYNTDKGLVVEGYTILQPRVAISLPSAGRSRFVKLFSGDPGIDPYTRTVSDVYQDVFHEGSFIGKGIYDVDAFEQTLADKFPENRILSHDLLEGSYARSGLVSDVQLFEEYPSSFNADARRRHRWMRGDWQIATWLLPRLPGPDVRRVTNPLTGLSRWKIFDNLRRSLVPSALVFLLATGWIFAPMAANAWCLFILFIIVLPSFLSVFREFLAKPKDLPWNLHLQRVAVNLGRQAGQSLLTVTFLAYDAVISLDAAVRSLGRLMFTRRRLLEWQTASDVEGGYSSKLASFATTMLCAPLLAGGMSVLLFLFGNPSAWGVVGVYVLWMISPVVAWWISQPLVEKPAKLSTEEIRELHKLARRTWNFFETFVTSAEHWLPPDNFQEYPRAVVATRTSPTNIGLALLASLSAYDFGYLSLRRLTESLGRTLKTVETLERYKGHFYNWYDTRTLKPLPPLYLSTVDNGNLSGMLLTLHSGLLELADQDYDPARMGAGLLDTFGVLKDYSRDSELSGNLETLGKILADSATPLMEAVAACERLMEQTARLNGAPVEKQGEFEKWRGIFEQSCREHCEEIVACCPWMDLPRRLQARLNSEPAGKLKKICELLQTPLSLRRMAVETEDWLRQLDELADEARAGADPELASLFSSLRSAVEAAGQRSRAWIGELEDLARRCERLARMDFRLLYNPARELFSIGYNVSQLRLDSSCYDLLASEARLASFVAIALGQVEQNHWFRLGRSLTSAGGRPTLISWSGSMFEYLMPMLVMPTYENTLLDISCKTAVERQIEYGRQIHAPWGISESGYNLRDADANYQYRAFGVPGLGFKRGLAQDVVIAPYATVMALMVAPEAASKNITRLVRQSAGGRFGLYEALDYTASRVPSGQTHAVVRSFMVHHQGMSLLALARTLLDRPMQRRFNSNPFFKSAELLLHERVPKTTSLLYPHGVEAVNERISTTPLEATMRIFTEPNSGPPEVHLLSNGRYHVMITNSGGGYSLWNNTLMTRWREDAARDCWGTFLYLRDVDSGTVWSPTHQPTLDAKLGYEAIFSQSRAEFRARLDEIESHLEITVSPENDVEVRRLTLVNHSDESRTIEITSCAEIVLNTAAAELAHPAFSNLFVQTHLLPRQNAVLCSRRPRASRETLPWAAHLLLVRGREVGTVSYETSREHFIGRGGTAAAPAALRKRGPLSNTAGSVLDSIAAIRRTVQLEPKESATATLVAGIAPTREGVTGLVERYQDQTIADRCFELAWTHGSIVLRHLNTTEAEAQLYGRLAGALLYLQPARRADPSVLIRNQRGQRGLWSFGISGDLPVVLLYSARADRIDLVRQLVQAHAYWRLKGLVSDLVILNEDDSVYRQALQDQILNLISAANATQLLDKPGGIFLRRADQVSTEDKILLETVARVVLRDENGGLAEQLQNHQRPSRLPPPLKIRSWTMEESTQLPPRDLLFFNGLGGFTRDGREYVITLKPGQTTPAPWVNVLANPNFGTLISESGGAYTWSENCHEFRLTPWNNDAVTDASGEAFYLRDEESGRFWSPTPLPARGHAPYVSRHGFGYSIFEHTEDDISSELNLYVAVHEPVKFAVFKLRNNSDRLRQLSLTGYWEWVLGDLRGKNSMHIVTEIDRQTRALLARNPYNLDFEGRVAFVSCSELTRSFTADRTEFFGRNGTPSDPAALRRTRLSGRVGVGFDPCAAMQVKVELEPGQEREIVFAIGAGLTLENARDLARRFQDLTACRDELQKVWDLWACTLGAVRVETPDPALDVLANGWLIYQIISCRLWARTGFYQSGGALGFRDQLQDSMALIYTRRELFREQLLRAAAHQFREGDVQHWWHPPQGRGVRTHFSDDYLWLPYATCRYVEVVGDTGVLDSQVPFLEGRPLRPELEANYDLPHNSDESGTLYEHCVRAIKNGLKFGEHGLPLMGCGDWNDGMNLVGEQGKGESVWLAFFLHDVLKKFSRLARLRGDQVFASRCDMEAETLAQNIEKNAWDGQWYRRAYFDSGEPLGSASNPECQIDSLPQSWAVLSGVGDPARARTALDAVAHRLVRREAGLIQLFDPPFDQSSLEPGYIKGYVPGIRENGGQYTHAAIWTTMAFALAGETSRAWELFKLINPVLHARTPPEIARYKTEPYVMAADVYSVPPHAGRGGWTWYTGSAGWMYRLIMETLLGLELVVDELRFAPKAPPDWKSFKVDYRHRETVYHLDCLNASGAWKTPPQIIVDGKNQTQNALKLVNDRMEHFVEVRFHL